MQHTNILTSRDIRSIINDNIPTPSKMAEEHDILIKRILRRHPEIVSPGINSLILEIISILGIENSSIFS